MDSKTKQKRFKTIADAERALLLLGESHNDDRKTLRQQSKDSVLTTLWLVVCFTIMAGVVGYSVHSYPTPGWNADTSAEILNYARQMIALDKATHDAIFQEGQDHAMREFAKGKEDAKQQMKSAEDKATQSGESTDPDKGRNTETEAYIARSNKWYNGEFSKIHDDFEELDKCVRDQSKRIMDELDRMQTKPAVSKTTILSEPPGGYDPTPPKGSY